MMNHSKVTKGLTQLSAASLLTFLVACGGTMPILGGSNGTVTGGAAGGNAAGDNKGLEKCEQSFGTLRLFEDQNLHWWNEYRRYYPQLGTTIPVIRMMVQQSNCFVIVERGQAMNAMMQEREMMNSGELRDGSNFGQGQMVAADFTLSPSIQFSQKDSGGITGAIGGLFSRGRGLFGGASGKMNSNEAATTLLLIENRSGVQVSAAVGSAKNYDFSLFGVSMGGGLLGGASGFSDTPEGKVLMSAFADSYNQMVMALRNYKPQEVKGGLGKGGTLQIGGNDDKMPTATKNSVAPKVVKTQVVHTPVQVVHQPQVVNVNRNINHISIDAYDEDALEDYYKALKTAVTLLSSFGSMTAAQLNELKQRGQSTQLWMAWSGMVTGQLETAKIELETWPLNAKQQGWAILGSKIEKYNELFNKHRANILANTEFDDQVRQSIGQFELVSEKTMFVQ